MAFCSGGRRSIQLSYGRANFYRVIVPRRDRQRKRPNRRGPDTYNSRVIRSAILIAISTLPLLADSAAGVHWAPPATWKPQAQRPMRAATYDVPAAPGDSEGAECAVFYFGAGQGGGVQANIDRWLGQFQEKPATPPQAHKRTVANMSVTTIEHGGTFLAGGPMQTNKTAKAGYQMVGVIVEAPEGNVFFKLTGPAKTVKAARLSFDKMIGFLKK